MLRLEHSDAIGRVLRLDDLSTLGVSTQTLAEEAIARGDWEQARSLVDYFYEEMRIMHGILTTWIRDILRYIVEHTGADDAGRARRLGRDGAHVGDLPHRPGRPRALPRGHCGR